ncbi:hypothetical protein G7Y41_08595 [Schaalia sp. ZJ405]|uniref:ACT domain-containing protein n=1 Tax=unclassified Schaalia TaxID=2691889 RepID=UPI0013EA24D4|nr:MULTISPECIES: ACT domain-containing protein [unclassified Schaalia]QPK81084.1 hypothetical protein G7Y41_08595 [Schaalia sp. ZJ405]
MAQSPDLDYALSTLKATPGDEYVFAHLDHVPSGIDPFAVIHDDDGYTIVVEKSQAQSIGLDVSKTYAQVILGLDANLDSIGITATIAQLMTARSIVANIITCVHHDHLFVQADRANEAVATLTDLAKNAQGWLPRG